MITVRIISGAFVDDFALADHGEVEHFMKTEGKTPGEVFAACIALGQDWELDITEASSDQEAGEWTVADIVFRAQRATDAGRTILLDGQPVTNDELPELIIDYIAETGWPPDVLADNSMSLILGRQDDDE